jgi:hypothetical protein
MKMMVETKLRARGSEVATTPTCNEKRPELSLQQGKSTEREHRRKPNKRKKGLFVRLCMPIHHNHVVSNSNLIVAAHHQKKCK